MSLPARGAWIEMLSAVDTGGGASLSLPARGAWIEIDQYEDAPTSTFVAPRTGGVD